MAKEERMMHYRTRSFLVISADKGWLESLCMAVNNEQELEG